MFERTFCFDIFKLGIKGIEVLSTQGMVLRLEDFNIAKIKERRKKLIKLVIYSVLFVVLCFFQIWINRFMNTGGNGDDVSLLMNLHGFISIVQVLIIVSMVTTSKKGFYFSMAAVVFDIVVLGSLFIAFRAMDIVTALAVIMVGGVICNIIHRYLVNLERNENELYNLANTDSLTELPNRRALKAKMQEAIDNCKKNNTKLAIAMIDLDNFKNVNDTIGHEYGDQVLLNISNRWRELMSDNDFMARLGGDEFAILVSDFTSVLELDSHLQEFMNAVESKMNLKNNDYYISASMGVAMFPSDTLDESQLLKYADMAMYTAKYQGKKRICYYDGMMDNIIENTVQLESVIRRAIQSDSFSLVYQPQYTAEDKRLRGFETLIRLSDSKGKQVSPGDFIPVAEKTNLIIDVDRWVMRNSMREFKTLLGKTPDILLSINISATHLLDACFLDDLDTIMKETGFPAANLELELTESVFVASIDKAKEVMKQIKSRGIHIALDDFGTGYSSLSYLRELPIDLLKIDKIFVDSIKDGPQEESFVAAIISLSRIMKFAVISEGVEDESQLETLRRLGCDYIQGFLWGKPQLLSDAKDIIDALSDNNK